MNRHSMREHVFKMIFSYEFDLDVEIEEHISNYLTEIKSKEEEDTYISKKVKGIVTNREAIEKVLKKAAKNWETNRMASVDLAILRVAIYEIFVDSDIPTNVAINEAIEIAKKYGGDASPKFVNGILANVVKLKKSNRDEHYIDQDEV